MLRLCPRAQSYMQAARERTSYTVPRAELLVLSLDFGANFSGCYRGINLPHVVGDILSSIARGLLVR